MNDIFRAFGEFRAGGKDRKREFIISTESKDRHGTIIKADAWDLSGFAGTGFFQHGTWSGNPDMALGPARVWKEDKLLIGEINFETKDLNEIADKVLRKIDNGTLKNTSVGFRSKRGHWGEEEAGEDINAFYFDAVELMEFSVVGVPSNKEAVKRDVDMDEFLLSQKSIKDSEELKDKRGLEAEIARLDFFKIKFSKNGNNGSS